MTARPISRAVPRGLFACVVAASRAAALADSLEAMLQRHPEAALRPLEQLDPEREP